MHCRARVFPYHPERWPGRLLLCAGVWLLGLPCIARAALPAGGLDLFWDHWLSELDRQSERHGPLIPTWTGPWRVTGYGLSVGGIKNNIGSASATGEGLAFETNLVGPVTIAFSYGLADSTTLHWTEADLKARLLLGPSLALSLGGINSTYTYKTNTVAATDRFKDEMGGVYLGVTWFKSPWPGWYWQLDGDVVPLRAVQNNGGLGDPGVSGLDLILTATVGFSIANRVDLSLLVRAMPSMGDTGSTSIQPGAGISLTF